MTCVGPGNEAKKAAPGSDAVAGGKMLRRPAGSVAVTGGRMLRSPQSGSLQPGMIGGIGGKLGAAGTPPVTTPKPIELMMVPVLVPTSAPTMLSAPVLVTAPEAVESAMVPALAPTKPPATLSAPTVTLPLACEPVMAPPTEFEATSPPAMLPSPACTLPVATDERIVPELLPTKPPA